MLAQEKVSYYPVITTRNNIAYYSVFIITIILSADALLIDDARLGKD